MAVHIRLKVDNSAFPAYKVRLLFCSYCICAVAMSLFRFRWALACLFNLAFVARLARTVRNPGAFYAALLLKLIPGLHRKPVALHLRDGKVVFIPSYMSLYIFEEVFLNGIYDPQQSIDVRTIIDIGANTGQFVLRAKQLWPAARIIAFEPEPGNFAELTRTIEANGLNGVSPINAAVMNRRGTVTLYRHPRNIGGHSTVHKHSADSISVPAETIEYALSLLPDGTCDLIKVDCEGAEEGIFRGLSNETAAKIKSIIYEPEWRLYSVDSLNAHLNSLGFSIRRAGQSIVADRGPVERSDSAPI